MDISKICLAMVAILVGTLFISGVEAAISYTDISPGDNYITSDETPEFRFRPKSNITELDILCRLYIDGSIEKEQLAINNSLTTMIPNPLSEGTYEWFISCTDDNNLYYSTGIRKITIAHLIITDLEVDPYFPEVDEEVEVTFTVENLMDQRLERLRVNVKINDLDINERIEDRDRINKNSEQDFKFRFTVPCDADEEIYEIEIDVRGRGEDDRETYEVFKTIEFEIDRKLRDICLIRSEIFPKKVECGSLVEVDLRIFNSGKRDEEDMYIVIDNSELDLQYKSSNFDLDRLKSKQNLLTFTVPEEVDSKIYPIRIRIYYDDGKKHISLIKSLEVECEKSIYSATISIDPLSIEIQPQETGTIEFTIKNTGNRKSMFEITSSDVFNWAELELFPSTIIIDAGESKKGMLLITPRKDAIGTRTIILSARHDGSTVNTAQFVVEIPEKPEEKISDVEIISEGEIPIFTGRIISDLNTETLALAIAIIFAVSLISISIVYKLKRK